MLKLTFDPHFLISKCQVLLIIKTVLIMKMLKKEKKKKKENNPTPYCQQKQVCAGKFTSSTKVILLINKTVIAKELKTFILP